MPSGRLSSQEVLKVRAASADTKRALLRIRSTPLFKRLENSCLRFAWRTGGGQPFAFGQPKLQRRRPSTFVPGDSAFPGAGTLVV